jgi:hypothetical protein
MKRLFTILILVLLPLSAYAWGVVGMSGGVAASGGTACVGWDNDSSDCSTVSIPSAGGSLSNNNTRARKWVATRSGTATRVRIYFYSTSCGDGIVQGVLYRGTTLIGTATLACSLSSWVWSGEFTAESGQSLSFSENDELYFGFCYSGATTSLYYGRDATNSPNDNYYYASGAPAAPASWTSGAYENAFMLEYTY